VNRQIHMVGDKELAGFHSPARGQHDDFNVPGFDVSR
jgi:hypothetical protein